MQVEGEALEPLQAAWERMRAELLDKLNKMAPGARQFSVLHYELLLVQADTALAAMAEAQGVSLRERCLKAIADGGRAEVGRIRRLEERYGDATLAARLEHVLPVVPVETVARMADAQRLILSGLRQRVREGIAGELAQSLAQGEGIAKATRRLREHLDGQGWQLERIARTEINNAINVGHHAAIEQVIADVPEIGMQKQWSAFLDSRTSATCRHLHGDVVEHDAPFVAPDWTGLYPPAHVNCRSRVLGYSARWRGRLQPRSPEQKAADEARLATYERPRRRAAVQPRRKAA